MGKKSRERQERRERIALEQPTNNNTHVPQRKKGLTNAKKMLIGIALVVIIAIGASVAFSSQTPPTVDGKTYPTNVSPVTYSQASVAADNGKVTVPLSEVNSSKLMFVDLKLTTPLQTLDYQGRTIPLTIYRDGGYLPLVIISTPSGNTVAGIRTCEPCGSFSFHIVKAAT